MKYIVHTDGSFNEKTGIGGWSCIITKGDGSSFELSDHIERRTSGEVELYAALYAISFLPMNSDIILITDYEPLGLFNTNLPKWKSNRWRNSRGKKLPQIWKTINEMCELHNSVKFKHISRGHNKEADKIANLARRAGELKALWITQFNKLFLPEVK